ncbi:hypothetical protein LHYA1_G005855 [Lachnellula hyalina]|uniref:Uncharacterized protein n=1 Tax=Lachnellula hyalina TaxID=1316788 RepID=A0A8H8TWH7_9HELO|nr:uncharacterized protein LHYA1_G005855 [Lachnellula hyalina]TVY24909.1 hypothetical protein LHYA1_G005855 [Lachnellula hyalina]
MAQLRPSPAISCIRPLSADFAPRPKDSILYSILPSAVQCRIPRLPSLRRTVSMYGLAGRQRSTELDSRPSSGYGTPEPSYTSAMVLMGGREEEYAVESVSDEDTSRPSTGEGSHPVGMGLTDSSGGINWKFANQGLSLLSLALEESSVISRDNRLGNASFARQLYIHSLTYLLRAMPPDLTTEEQLSVRSALPSGVVETLRVEVHPSHNQTTHTNQPSVLHRTLASIIIQLFLFFQFIIPYLKYLLHSAYQYDREHKISEKVLSQGIETIDVLGKQSLSLTSAICGMGDGKVGQVITRSAAWVVEGVTGGIHEGVGEGMVIVGARIVERRP